jgi:hypothetical protein
MFSTYVGGGGGVVGGGFSANGHSGIKHFVGFAIFG